MKRGELVILWIGGVLSVVLLLVQASNTPDVASDVERTMGGMRSVGGHFVATVFILWAIWIICLLVWITIYRRKP